MSIGVQRRGTFEWDRSLSFVQERYRSIYESSIRPDPDICVTSIHPDGSIAMVAGVTFHSEKSPLFAQKYFDTPLIDLINQGRDEQIEPAQIAEIGPLAATGGGIAKTPFVDQFLKYSGVKEAVFTVTPRLATALIQSGRVMRYLGPAQSDRLDPASRDIWGTYYEHKPLVLSSPVTFGEITELSANTDLVNDLAKKQVA